MKLRPWSGALAATALLLSTTASAAASAPAVQPATETVAEGSELDSIRGLSPTALVVGAIAIGLLIYFVFIDDDDDDDDDDPVSP